MRTKQEPKCPNHGKTLEECGRPLPEKGIGVCPVSGSTFSFEKMENKEGEVEWKTSGGEIGDY